MTTEDAGARAGSTGNLWKSARARTLSIGDLLLSTRARAVTTGDVLVSAQPALAAQRERALRFFGVYLAGHVALEHWFVVAAPWNEGESLHLVRALLASVAATVVCLTQRTQLGMTLLASVLLASMLIAFPGAPNHFLIELLCLLALASHDHRRAADASQLAQILLGLLAATLFGAGVQKVLYGTYTEGTYLAFAIAHSERFAQVFSPLLSSAELARMDALSEVYRDGAGPYVLESSGMLALSNGVYLAELGLSVMLVVPRTRTIAALATIALLCAIEVTAQEAFFGCLTLNLAALATGSRRYEMIALVSLALLALVLAGRAMGLSAFAHVN